MCKQSDILNRGVSAWDRATAGFRRVTKKCKSQGIKEGDLYVCILYKGILMPRNNCMSRKVVAERMVYDYRV